MTAWIIVAIILLLLLFLLLSPAMVDVSYRLGKAEVCARYLFLRFDLLPDERQPPKKEKPKKPKKKKPEKDEKEKDKKDTLSTALALVKSAGGGLGILRRHLIFSRVRIYISVGGADAAQAAQNCGKVNLGVLSALDLIGLLFVLRDSRVGILPDFLSEETRADLSLRVSIRPLFVIAAACSVLFRFLRVQSRGKSKANQPENIKGGSTA